MKTKKYTLLIISALFTVYVNAQTDSLYADHQDTIAIDQHQPIFSTTVDDIDNDINSQDVSALLQASKDIVANYSSFHFSQGNFRLRGYSPENQAVLINGINVNNLETGFSSWSAWAGLNDVTRYTETRIGLGASRLTFGGIGGYTNIDSKASSFKKGTRVSYANGNRVFQHRLMFTTSTGMLSNGWAVTVSGSMRCSDAEKNPKMYSPGTYFNGYSYYLSADKRVNDKQLFSFTAFGAPTEQGKKSMDTQEAYDLAGSNYYNSYWGYQYGQIRNSKIATSHKPMMMASHILNLNTNSKLTTSAYFTFGKSGITGINWYDAKNPRPDYYKYLPSYYSQNDPDYAALLSNIWCTNVNTRQVNWDEFYNANRKNLFTVPNANGISGNTIEGNRSKYILENAITAVTSSGFNSVYNTRRDKLFITAGFNATIFKSHHYKVVQDLLGGDFWIDYNWFAEGLGEDSVLTLNNIEAPNKLIKTGDKFGYNYNVNVNRCETWGQAEYSFSRMDVYGSLSLSNSTIWREGFYANGQFPNNSKGLSQKVNFYNYGLKTGFTYKLNGRNFITANFGNITRNPEAANVFVSPQSRNTVVSPLKNEKVTSYDLSYLAKFSNFKARITFYNSVIKDQIYLKSYYHDEYNTLVNYIMTGVNTSNKGIELGLEGKLFTALTITGVFCYSENIYTNRPVAQAWRNNSSELIFENRTVYLKNYHLGGSPQTVAGTGLKYSGKKFWFVGVNANYLGGIYIEPNPDRRTAETLSKYVSGDPQYAQLLKQDKLQNNFTFDANAGKSWRLKNKYALSVNVSVTNFMNNQKFRINGQEQLRYSALEPNKFPNKYSYAQGATYMAMLSFGF